MSPRPYRMGQRQATIEQTRARILTAARELLTAPAGITGFSIEAVARQADVARMTVYYQFGNKVGLLEALSDMLATQGGLHDLPQAFSQPDARAALFAYIGVFCRFWEENRLVTRRINALSDLDADFSQVIQARNERRRQGVRVLVGRYSAQNSQPRHIASEDVIDSLYTLLGFASCDMLAGSARPITEIVPLVQSIALAILTFPGPEPANSA